MISIITSDNFYGYCNQLAEREPSFKTVIQRYRYPPLWHRPARFDSLVHIILEQKVSIASAKAAFVKLKHKLADSITPSKVLLLTDDELKDCYFSRQKIVYVRYLAEAIVSKKLSLKKLNALPDNEVRTTLTKIKGIGSWTADVYLLLVLKRTDVFPIGDLALVNALRELKQLPKSTHTNELLAITLAWKPLRSVAAMLLWHYYIQSRNIRF
jgi:DNA-3-methyladenine glycosylase II